MATAMNASGTFGSRTASTAGLDAKGHVALCSDGRVGFTIVVRPMPVCNFSFTSLSEAV